MKTEILLLLIASKGLSIKKIALLMGMSKKTFCKRLINGTFGSKDLQSLAEILGIKNPADIFFD